MFVYIQRSPRDLLHLRTLEPAIVAALHASGRLIVQAPTGSGKKSTQIPQDALLRQRLLGARGEVTVLQPLAARPREAAGLQARPRKPALRWAKRSATKSAWTRG